MESMLDSIGDKMIYVEKFLLSFIQNDSRLVFLRMAVTKLTQIESANASQCIYCPTDRTLQVQTKNDTQPIKISTRDFDKIEWLELSSGKRQAKVIQITIKEDKVPIILGAGNSGQEVLDFWYDGLRLEVFNQSPTTESSNQKVKVFEQAVNYAQKSLDFAQPQIPPPPATFDYPPAPKIPVILAKKQQ